MALAQSEHHFIPAMGLEWLLPIYDPFTRLLGIDSVRKALIERADLRQGHSVLDVGCGTGSLAVLTARLHPGVRVFGIDPDAKALARARRKAHRSGVSIQFDRGFAGRLPYVEASFDRVFSSFMFHHLDADEKITALVDIRRVLKAGGTLHLVDFAGADAGSHGLAGLLHTHRRLKDNAESRVLELMSQAGLQEVRNVARHTLVAGRLRIDQYEAWAPVTNRQ
jgi:ubiquinone/menaquinone biosynthesis C-methylase UbiE